ncbi:MAG: HYR domain-containing protein [Bacteroidota bacterium]
MNLTRTTFLKLLAITLGFLISLPSFAVTRTAGNGAWNNANTWTPSGVPTSGDDVIIPSGRTVTVPATLLSLSFNTLDITGTLSVGGFTNNSTQPVHTFSGATITVNNNGFIRIGGDIDLEADIIINSGGVVEERSYDMTGINGTPTITINVGGTLRPINLNNTSNSSPTFDNVDIVNFGSINKNGGNAGTNIFAGAVTNEATGTITTSTSSLRLDFAGTLLNKPGGDITTGFYFVSGTFTNNGTITLSPDEVTGTLNGDGTFSNPVTIAHVGLPEASIGPDACLTFASGLSNSSIFTVDITGTNPCTDYEQQTVIGTTDISAIGGGATLVANFVGYTPTISDLFTIVSGDGTNSVVGSFSSTNLPANMEAVYNFPNTGDISIRDVNYTPAPGNFISVQSGDWDDPTTWDANAVPGSNDNVTIDLNHTVTADGLTLEFLSLTINGPADFNSGAARGTLTISGSSASTISSTGNIISNGNINFIADLNLGCDIISNDRINWQDGDISGTGSPTITNSATGRFNMAPATGSTVPSGERLASVDVVNFSVAQHIGGQLGGIYQFGGTFTNKATGTVLVQNVGRDIEFQGTLVNETGGSVTAQFGGRVFLEGSVDNDGTITNPQPITGTGTVEGEGTFIQTNGSISTIISLGVTLGPDACLNFNTGSGLGIEGTLSVNVSGPTACTDYDQQITDGALNLGANSILDLNFGSYTPSGSEVFTIVQGNGTDAVIGAFNTVNGLPTGYAVEYDFPNTGDVSLRDPNFSNAPLEFVVSEEVSGVGQQVTVSISVNNFDDVVGYQGTITFDEAVLSVASTNVPLTAFQTTSVVGLPGQGSIPTNALTFSWFDQQGVGATLTDGTDVLEITFDVAAGAPTGFTDVEIDGSVVALGYSDDINSTSLLSPDVDQGGVDIDATAPVITCPSTGITVDNDAGVCGAVVTFSAATATDNFPGAITITQIAGPASGSVFPLGTTTVTFEATDAQGNSSTCSFDVTVNPASGTTVVSATEVITPATCADAADGAIDITPAGGVAPYTFSWSNGETTEDVSGLLPGAYSVDITDVCGTTVTENFTVNFVDNIDPNVVINPTVQVTLDASGNGTLLVGDVDNGSNDACGLAAVNPIVLSQTSFGCADIGASIPVTVTVTDVNGNTATGTTQVTVVDNTAPNVVTQPFTVELDANGNGTITPADIENGSTDACGIDANTFSLSQTAFTCADLNNPVTVTLFVDDVNGNTGSATAVVTVEDNIDPVVTTFPTATLTLDPSGNATLTLGDVDNGSTDNCGIANRTLSRTAFDCDDVALSPITVTLTVTDASGNSETGTTDVTVVASPNIAVSGEARTETTTNLTNTSGTLIPAVNFDLSGDNGPQTSTGSTYSFDVDPCDPVNDVGADRNNDTDVNGINVQDAIDVVRHFLLIDPLNSPYKLIAADVNDTESINVLDAFQIIRRFLGIRSSFVDPVTGNNGGVWTFIPESYSFPNPASPWGFDTRIDLLSVTAPLPNQDFVGVKLGDVNNSWDVAPSRMAAPSDSIQFVIDAAVAQPGEYVRIPVSVRDFNNVSGYQYTIEWDASVLEFESINDVALEGIYNTEQVKNGRLASAWIDINGQSVSLEDETVAFEMVFKVVGDRGSKSSFAITQSITSSQARNLNGVRLGVGVTNGDVQVGVATQLNELELAGYGLGQNAPNPFSDLTQINFSLGQTEEIEMVIYNMTGQQVRRFKGTYAAGQHEIKWDGTTESGIEVGQGVYLVHLRAGEYSASIRMKKTN